MAIGHVLEGQVVYGKSTTVWTEVRPEDIQYCGRCATVHYLDDFLLAGAPDSDQCELGLRSSQEWLGVPIAALKTEGSVTSLVFLGIEIDTVHLTMRLQEGKLTRLQGNIRKCEGR